VVGPVEEEEEEEEAVGPGRGAPEVAGLYVGGGAKPGGGGAKPGGARGGAKPGGRDAIVG
jgi:hypothetical protein